MGGREGSLSLGATVAEDHTQILHEYKHLYAVVRTLVSACQPVWLTSMGRMRMPALILIRAASMEDWSAMEGARMCPAAPAICIAASPPRLHVCVYVRERGIWYVFVSRCQRRGPACSDVMYVCRDASVNPHVQHPKRLGCIQRMAQTAAHHIARKLIGIRHANDACCASHQQEQLRHRPL